MDTRTFQYNWAACVSIHTAPRSRIGIPNGWGRSCLILVMAGENHDGFAVFPNQYTQKNTRKRRWQQNLGLGRNNEWTREDGALIPLRKEKKDSPEILTSPLSPVSLGFYIFFSTHHVTFESCMLWGAWFQHLKCRRLVLSHKPLCHSALDLAADRDGWEREERH